MAPFTRVPVVPFSWQPLCSGEPTDAVQGPEPRFACLSTPGTTCVEPCSCSSSMVMPLPTGILSEKPTVARLELVRLLYSCASASSVVLAPFPEAILLWWVGLKPSSTCTAMCKLCLFAIRVRAHLASRTTECGYQLTAYWLGGSVCNSPVVAGMKLSCVLQQGSSFAVARTMSACHLRLCRRSSSPGGH